MLYKHFAILTLLAGLPAIAQETSTAVSPSTTAIHLHRHSPMKLAGVPVPGAVSSYNWSGYAAVGNGFTKALGSWIVPTVDCTKTPSSYSSYWVGIDGYASGTLEQIGTSADCVGSTPTYYAWYEFYPNPPKLIAAIPAKPGDKMSATVSYLSGQFTLKMTDHTVGTTVKVSKSLPAARTSAEWIVEAPSSIGVLPLADFTKVSLGDDFTGVGDTDWAVNSAVTGPISDFGGYVQKITMVTNSGATKAAPSALTTDGSSFKVAWKHE